MEKAKERTGWFMDSRFGMFIHWGIYAVPARGEWVRSNEKISSEDYQQYFDEFNPVNYDPGEWARIARNAGMKYAVLTAKHHDGFCLFDSKYTDYKSTNTPCGRDLVREYAEAFRKEGLRVGLYYSLIDWHHDNYPAFGDACHPMRDNEAYRNRKIDFSRYIDYMHGQVKELMTGYGKIDIVWFDFSYGEMKGEVWKATKLVETVRSLQPGIIIDNRLGGNIKSLNPEVYAGDFASPEQIIPPEGVLNEAGKRIPWEACITMNNNWGYCSSDKNFKPSDRLIRALVECVSKGGNLLLNVGPDARGRIPEESVNILSGIGKWMEKNSRSIYGCGVSMLPKPEWGRYTQNGNLLYAHIYEKGIGEINLRGLGGQIKKARLVRDGSEVQFQTPRCFDAAGYGNDAYITFAGERLPDEADTVVELELV